jgi:pimeloyl-ACP methyl ester carboxylesterase
VLAAYLERGPSSLWRQAAQVPVPTLLVYGRRDKLVDVRTSRRALATFPDARLVVLPNSGHVAMMEHPAIVARAFREFVPALADRHGGN